MKRKHGGSARAGGVFSLRRPGLALLPLLLVSLAAGPLAELTITGKILYDGRPRGTTEVTSAAVVDIVKVYGQNPAYMHMRAQGLRETDAAGRKLFAAAQASTHKALAESARAANVKVITIPGGVTGGDVPPRDLTQHVIDKLPVYYVDGVVLHGRTASARSIAVIDQQTLLAAIPAYQEARPLSQDDARYHILRDRYTKEFQRVVKAAARQGGHDAIVQRGGVISRLGPVQDVTSLATGLVDA